MHAQVLIKECCRGSRKRKHLISCPNRSIEQQRTHSRSISMDAPKLNSLLPEHPPPRPLQCPRGSYRVRTRGRGVEDCALCPVNTYQNTTGATAETDCVRCPNGFYAELEGTAECSCITEQSCLSEWRNDQRDSMPFVGRM